MTAIRVRSLPVWLTGAALACAVAAIAGGFGIQVSLPDANDANQKGAFLVVRPVGCMGPGASLSVRAEGLVDGARKSESVTARRVSEHGQRDPFDTYVIKRTWPAHGAWVVVFTATQGKTATRALVEMNANGTVRTEKDPQAKTSHVAVTYLSGDDKKAVDAALKQIASQAGATTASARR